MVREIVWDKEAKEEFKRIYQHIKKKSTPSANKVKSIIFEAINKLSLSPEIYEKDRFVEGHPNVRSFTRWHFRIVYEITETRIVILMIYHTSQDPLKLRRLI